jgi:hypothetical protein
MHDVDELGFLDPEENAVTTPVELGDLAIIVEGDVREVFAEGFRAQIVPFQRIFTPQKVVISRHRRRNGEPDSLRDLGDPARTDR